MQMAKTFANLLNRWALCGILFWGASAPALAAEQPFIGSQSCNSASCHGRLEPRRVGAGNNNAGLQEFLFYERHDPHAKAAQTLVGPEFDGIIGRLTKGQNSQACSEIRR